ncbi:hypothetical protein MTO96_041893 [Rhipicephalus appendiculatus]
MKVNLTAQTLSSSVADVNDFCREELKLPEFKGSEATVEFIRLFDQLFNCLDSRKPLAMAFKAPLRPGGKGIWMALLAETKAHIRGLNAPTGIPIFKDPAKDRFS